MTPTNVLWIVAAALLLAVALSFLVYHTGYKRGIAVGWCEHHFGELAKERARLERERARRNRIGQFKGTEVCHGR
jgi:hypothetical protein